MIRIKKVLIVLICSLMVAACGESKPNKLNYQIESFQFMDQNRQSFGLADLKNKVWVANFMFTHCTTVCPTLTANMAQLQKELKQSKIQAELVSFSVDPEKDDPDMLKTYIGKFSEDFTNWHGLTGYAFKDIQNFSRSNFKAAVEKDTANDQVIHGTSFYLVNKTGTIVAKYDGLEPPYKQMVKDIKALSK